MKDIIDIKKYKKVSNLFLTVLILLTILQYTPLPELITLTIFQNYFMPLLWGIICFLFWHIIPRIHSSTKLKRRDSLLIDVILCATALLGFRLLGAFLIDEFGESPYDLSVLGVLKNMIRMGPELVAKELIRSYFLCTYCKKSGNPAFWIISIVIAFSNISLDKLLQLNNIEVALEFFAKKIGPELSFSIILSTFALHGGPKLSILYATIIKAFLLFFPILPNLRWITEGVISISVPVIEAFYIADKYELSRKNKRGEGGSIFSIISWTLTLSLSVLFIWFIVGVFPYYPQVIATGSMRPLIIEGDVVIIKKAMVEENIYNLKPGDIIQFSRDDILITHRILQVFKDKNGNLSFQTKGDNNSAIDSRIVMPNEVRGTLVKVIPKVGLPTLLIKSRRIPEPEGVEN